MELIKKKNVMLSYNGKSEDIVRMVYNILRVEPDIEPWFAEVNMGNDLYEGYVSQHCVISF